MARKRRANLFMCGDIPQDNRFVAAPGSKSFPIGTEGKAVHWTCMSCERWADGFLCIHIPQDDCFVGASGSQDLPIRAEGHAID